MKDEYNIKKLFFFYIAEFLDKYPYRKIDARVMELQHYLTMDMNNTIDPIRNGALKADNIRRENKSGIGEERDDHITDLIYHAIHSK